MLQTSYAEIFDLAISPDGQWVAYSLNDPSRDPIEIWVARADGREDPVLLTTGHCDFAPCWFPDSQRLAFERDRGIKGKVSDDDIYIVDRTQEGSVRPLVELGDGWWIGTLACSPDGKTILFERVNPVPPEGGYLTKSIWSLDVESGQVTKLPLEGESLDSPAWFPDGSSIAYCALVKRKDPRQIRRCKPDGSDQKTLMLEPAYSPRSLTISPDGRYVMFVDSHMLVPWTRMYALEVETYNVLPLTAKGRFRWESPSWGPLPAETEEGHER